MKKPINRLPTIKQTATAGGALVEEYGPDPTTIKRTPKNDMEADLMFEFYHRKLGKHKGD